MAEAAALIPHIHHERQEEGSMLCAQHALNTLLQGNYYDPSQLSDIAKQLDELEQNQVDEETWRQRDQASLNMDDTGYFSVSVLEQALEVWGLRLIRWRSEVMRPFQSKPEEQLAFILNLDSHWFTIRGFTGGYWFNLNSFLEKPSWVGPSYLGALLNAAESEGYSVFVVAQDENARNDFHSSTADDCAATLPPADQAGAQGAANEITSTTTQGLKPKLSSPSASKSGLQDEEADLQAALRASLAEADAAAAASASITAPTLEQNPSSGMHSPTIAGHRRTRGGGIRDPDVMSASSAGNDVDEEETDDQVDAIAPSRRRVRGLAPPLASALAASITTPSASATASASTSSRGSPYILPTASGGRRRASRQQGEDDELEQGGLRRNRASGSGGGTSHDTAIGIDDDDEGDQSVLTARARRAGRSNAPIEILDDDVEDDYEQMHAVGSTPRSPFLNPALVRSGGSTNSDDDFHSLSSGEEDADLGESWVQNDIDMIRRQTTMQDRAYDDEDAELQAALAASMRETGSASITEALANTIQQATNASANRGNFEDDLAAASWINEEDSRAIREAQASFSTNLVRQASNGSNKSPPPADVEKIMRLRAEAKKKAEEEELMRSRGEDATVLAENVAASSSTNKKSRSQAEEEDDEDSSDDEPQMSPEEMRKARLARFGM
jgi:Ataxin-3